MTLTRMDTTVAQVMRAAAAIAVFQEANRTQVIHLMLGLLVYSERNQAFLRSRKVSSKPFALWHHHCRRLLEPTRRSGLVLLVKRFCIANVAGRRRRNSASIAGIGTVPRFPHRQTAPECDSRATIKAIVMTTASSAVVPEPVEITPALLAQHSITADEYSRIEAALGRVPSLTELGIYSVMWSEHCSYKSSRVHLKRLPTKSELVVQGPGENAGIIDVGDGWACAFKIESHNHPSYIEPFQGAATGVGGILRDIFTMGARPPPLLFFRKPIAPRLST